MRRADPPSRKVVRNVYASLSVIRRNNNFIHLQRVGRSGQTKTTGFSQQRVIYFPENINRIAYVIGDREFRVR